MTYTRISDYQIVLGSQSPRRKELLQMLGITFTTIQREIPENYPQGMPAKEVAQYLSRIKAEAFDELANEKTIIITADTIVSIDTHILGKPSDATEAKKMLQMLSGRKHEVISGVTLRKGTHFQSWTVSTEVYFKMLDEAEIDYYICNYKPFDKAGSYGIQEWIGLIGIEKINGSYFNVVGLPVKEIYKALREMSEEKNA